MPNPRTSVAMQHQYSYCLGTRIEPRLSIRPPVTPHEYREVMAEVAKWIDADEYDSDGDLAAAVFRVLVEFAGYYTELVNDETPRDELRVSDFEATMESVMENLELRAEDGTEPAPVKVVEPEHTVTPARKKELQRIMQNALTRGDLQLARIVLDIIEGTKPELAEWEWELLLPEPITVPNNPDLWG